MGFIGRDEKWGSRKWALTVFFSILILHSVAILFFISGFLLTRTELPHYSQCSDVSQSPCNLHHQGECWTKPSVDRVVIIVLDALRFDFVAPSTFFEEKKPWMDKLQVLHKLASQPNTSARIFKAIADPPTTSLQRLKGLTTGGLPTFIDIGNSFGAPAIVEDNLMYQLAQNGKRVVMMGDDTWLQCFPRHFNKSYPFPSFNVKDLDTVDNGCIEHLFPNLLREDWDVLIAHFLGVVFDPLLLKSWLRHLYQGKSQTNNIRDGTKDVFSLIQDHAGHIFGVDSSQMDEKLEQYNDVLEKVVDVLVSQSGPGGLHENTLLIVMGDHGQTVNGDHGGGSAEEVETSIFAMSLRKPSPSVPLEFDLSSCRLDLGGRNVCISSIEQLDFAVTVSALLGVPFPYGSIGRVNPMMYAMAADTWILESYDVGIGNPQSRLNVEAWMHNYANVLCINSWQVKKYIDVYSASSVVGFSKEDLVHVTDMHAQAMNFSTTLNDLEACKNASCKTSLTTLKKQIELYSKFLASIAELARVKWTEFNLGLMGVGFGVMLISIIIHLLLIKKVDKLCGVFSPSYGSYSVSSGLIFACIAVLMRACSFLSNSYILEEGKVSCFLLASTGIFYLRYSMSKKKKLFEAVGFVFIISMLRFSIELGLSKQGISGIPYIEKASHIWINIADIMSMLPLIILAYILYKSTAHGSCQGFLKYVIFGTILSYILIAAHWALESNLTNLVHRLLQGINGNYIPRVIYLIGFIQLLFLALVQLVTKEEATHWETMTLAKSVTMISAWSSTVIILSGKQGPLAALAMVVGGWLITRLKSLEQDANNRKAGLVAFYSSPVTQWSLLASCVFFSTGHWCAFDGLRWGAAFIGFDEFNLTRQAILLSIDTFGFSHILPTFGLPFLVTYQYPSNQTTRNKKLFFMQLFEVYLIYGLIMAVTTTFTIVCVIIQRRHLMVWGLFAPKFVFDVVGLILTDIIICIASLFYFVRS